MEPIIRQEAIDNLRVAVKATLLVCPQRTYRLWAQKSLEQSEPLMDGLDEIRDMATDSIEALAGWKPWQTLGRARECWFAIREICRAHKRYAVDDYHNASLHCMTASKLCMEISKRSTSEMLVIVRSLERSLYGETVT